MYLLICPRYPVSLSPSFVVPQKGKWEKRILPIDLSESPHQERTYEAFWQLCGCRQWISFLIMLYSKVEPRLTSSWAVSTLSGWLLCCPDVTQTAGRDGGTDPKECVHCNKTCSGRNVPLSLTCHPWELTAQTMWKLCGKGNMLGAKEEEAWL